MVTRVSLGLFLVLSAVSMLGILAIPSLILGLVALVAGFAVWFAV